MTLIFAHKLQKLQMVYNLVKVLTLRQLSGQRWSFRVTSELTMIRKRLLCRRYTVTDNLNTLLEYSSGEIGAEDDNL